MIAELNDAATDGQTPQRLEGAVAQAFEYLGFAVDQIGGSGDTDVRAHAPIGPASYTVVVDAKARRGGKVQDLQAYALQEHLRKNEADYAVVVAGNFAEGRVVRQAEDGGIVLLPVAVLGAWLRLHESTPLNLSQHRAMFATPGLRSGLLPRS
ncbi:MAG: restriction endonuclease [Anaerolineae bacterium]|nr:restriction endonuclease [Anaerolineae bacterium]